MLAVAIATLLLSQSSEMQASRQAAREESLPLAGGGAALELTPSRDGKLGDLVFRAPLVPGGTDALPAPICINGICKDPICRYRAKDATATSWPAWGFGETLTRTAGGGTAPTQQSAEHLGRAEQLTQFYNAGKYFASATASNCQIGTEDLIVEAVWRVGQPGGSGIVATTGPAGGSNDYIVSEISATTVGVYLRTGGVVTAAPVTTSAGALVHMVFGVDRGYANATYGGRTYLNGALGASADFSARSASLDSGTKFVIGAHNDGSYVIDGAVLYLAIWKQSDWLPGTAANATILDAIAADRSARFWGTREVVSQYAPTFSAAGPRCAWTATGKLDCYSATAPILGGTIPQGMTGAGTPSGGGYLSAPAGTQALLYSREFLTGWTLTGTTPVATSGVTSPFVDARATYAITDNDGAGEEYISQTLDITALGTGDDIALCPIAAVASSTQLYTVSVTEQTGGSCTTTTTHYKPTATTTWQQQAQAHDVLDGDCTQAVITVRPYDVASGGAATGSVSVLMNAYLGRDYCQPYYVESTSAAVASGEDKLTYDVTAILGTAAQKRLGGAMRFDLSRIGTAWVPAGGVAGNLLTESGNCPSIYYPNAPANQLNYYWNSGVVIQHVGAAVSTPGTWVEHDAHTGRPCAAGDCGLMLARPGHRKETSMVACASGGGTLYVGGRSGQFLPFGTQIRNVEVYR